MSSITFNPTSISVTAGATATSEFVIPGDGVDTAAAPLKYLCGTKNYAITKADGSAVTTWAAITDSTTPGSKKLTIDTTQYGSFIASTTTVTLTITTTLSSWSANSGSTSTIVVTLNPNTCSCTALGWTAPTIGTNTVNVAASSTPTIPVPVSNTNARSTNPAFDSCYAGNTPCATTGSYPADSIVLLDGTALPSWITWNASTQILTAAPTTPSLVGTYTLKATYSPTYGTAAQFSVLTITVRCVVTSMTRPSNPTTGLTYNVWDKPLSFDFSQTWVQTPACGYVYTDSFTWTGLNSYILQDSATPGRINVVTSLLSGVNTYTVSVQNTITIANNGGSSSTFSPADTNDKVSFVITIVDPCRTTTLPSLTVSGADSSSPYSKGVTDG